MHNCFQGLELFFGILQQIALSLLPARHHKFSLACTV